MKRLFASLMAGMLLFTLPLASFGFAAGPFEPAAPGTTITVTTPLDDTIPGNCTLREAIRAANLDQKVDNCPAGSGADTIILPLEAYTLSLYGDGEDEGLTGDLDITSPVTIRGTYPERGRIQWVGAPDVTLQEQLLHILPAAQNVTLEYLRFSGEGDAYWLSGILNEGELTLDQVDFVEIANGAFENKGDVHAVGARFFENTLDSTVMLTNHGGAHFEGTGLLISDNQGDGTIISSGGEMHLQDSQISGNAFGYSSGITNDGLMTLERVTISGAGGIYSMETLYNSETGTLTMTNSTMSNNFSAAGMIANKGQAVIRSSTFHSNATRFGPGVIRQQGGTVRIEDTLFWENQARNQGMIAQSGGSLLITGSTIAGSRTQDGGPTAIQASGPISITNTTISGNRGESNGDYTSLVLGNAELDHVTITGNTVPLDSGDEWNAVLVANGTVRIHASILAGNLDGFGGSANDCTVYDAGEIISLGYNLVGNADLCNWTSAAGDQLGTLAAPLDPLLGPLADHGGPTLTHPLLVGSPAIDAVISDTLLLDQRGVLRQAGSADIGAYEAIYLSMPATGAPEGDDTDGLLAFPVTLSSPAVEPVTITYVTTDSTALAWMDYLPASGTLVLPTGTLTTTIPVTLVGDRVDEWDKSFFLHLSDIENALLDTPIVTGTVQDDDPPAVLSIQEQVSVPEGDAGWTAATAPIELSMPSAYTIEVSYKTQDDSALAGEDYQPISGTLSIPPGAHAVTLTVQIAGDDVFELDEDFSILLTDPVHAGLARSQAFVTIQNDDLPEPGLRMYLPCLRKQE